MTNKDLAKFLAEKVYKNQTIRCPSSFTTYNDKICVELRKFWNLMYKVYGIKTYEEGREWTDVVCDQISEKSLKQKLGFYCKYGTLNAPRGMKQLLEIVMRDNNISNIYVEPIDSMLRPDSFCYFIEDYNNYRLFDNKGNRLFITEEEYNEMINK